MPLDANPCPSIFKETFWEGFRDWCEKGEEELIKVQQLPEFQNSDCLGLNDKPIMIMKLFEKVGLKKLKKGPNYKANIPPTHYELI